MRVSFSGFEQSLDISPAYITVLEIENRSLFARTCQSLLSGQGEGALEPYSLWSPEDNRLKASDAFIPIVNPFALPWNDRTIVGNLYRRYEAMFFEDDEIRQGLESLERDLQSRILSIGFQLGSEYEFALEWDLQKHLKMLGFGVAHSAEDRLLDNLIKFLSLLSDISFSRVVLFVNLKTFLSENDIIVLYEQVFFSGIQLLLLENYHDITKYGRERKLYVDQRFLEHA